MAWKVMVSAPYMQPVLDRFKPVFDEHEVELVVPEVDERLCEDELLELVHDIDGAICGDDRFTQRVLQQAARLKVIAKWGTGIDSIDTEACQRLGIAVRNTPDAFSQPVADTVMGYVLCFARNLARLDREMKQGDWHKTTSRALRECTLGVIGVGNVGKAVVRRAVAFGMRVLGNDLVDMPDEFLAQTGIEMVSKHDLLCQADFISLNCDLNPTSYHLMDESRLALMKPSAVVVNTSRGPVIAEAALVEALQQGRIAGAALDVFEIEPLPAESPLRQMDNVLLAPHNANSSPEAWEHVHRNTIRNLLEVLEESSI